MPKSDIRDSTVKTAFIGCASDILLLLRDNEKKLITRKDVSNLGY